jgi:hypothetical protein
MENWTKSWGFSGLVGEWHMELIGGQGDDIKGRFKRLIDVSDRIVPLLKRFHQLRQVQIDLSLLSEELQENGEIKEEEFLEDVELDAKYLDDLVPALKSLVRDYPTFLITRVNIDLDTQVLEGAGEIIFPESAELYIGTDSYAPMDKEVELYISFSTFIDVWLPKTLGQDGVWRDNTEPSKLNHPRLQAFLQALEENFEGKLIKGDSHYYSEFLQKNGFMF